MAPSVRKQIATWNPARDVWEETTTGLFCEHSDVFSETWPASGMTLRGQAFELPTWAHRTGASGSSSSPGLLPTPTVSDTNGPGMHGTGGARPEDGDLAPAGRLTLLPTPRSTDGTKGGPNQRVSSGDLMLPSAVVKMLPEPAVPDGRQRLLATPTASVATGGPPQDSRGKRDLRLDIQPSVDFGQYAAAIERWNAVTRPAPSPTEPTGKGGAQRLSPRFVEWMQGLPEGHVTDPAIGISRNDQLKALGNGVVPQQCLAAIRYLLTIRAAALDMERAA